MALAWHDLRRTFATEMGEHAAAPFAVVDGLLNHAQAASKTGAARAYHHAVERLPKTAAMNAWDRIVGERDRRGLLAARGRCRQCRAAQRGCPMRTGKFFTVTKAQCLVLD